jgi:dTDP-4-amino-4,6-dideoxygalactose transaminase
VKKNEHAFYGGNSRLDELHAAMLRVKLRVLTARNERRAQIASYYNERLAGLVVTPPTDPRRVAVFHQYVIRTPKRDDLRSFLTAEGIETGVHYPTPIHRQAAWRAQYGDGPALPRAERVAREILSIPVFPELTDAEVERVAEAVARFFG